MHSKSVFHLFNSGLGIAVSIVLLAGCASDNFDGRFGGVAAQTDDLKAGDIGDGDSGGGTSCNPASETAAKNGAETITKLDIMFVVDTSGSLDAEREAAANGIVNYVDNLPAGTDYQVGVLLAHYKGGTAPGLYKRGSEPKVLRSSAHSKTQIQTDLLAKLRNGIQSEGVTDGGEAGLYATYKMMEASNVATIRTNDGFFRQDSALAIIYLADENDICVRGPDPVEDTNGEEVPFFNGECIAVGITPTAVRNRIIASHVKADNTPLPVSIAGVVYNDPDNYPAGGENEYGFGYMDLIMLNNAGSKELSANLADGANIATNLSKIAGLTSETLGAISRHQLAKTNVDPSSIQVKVNGTALGAGKFNYNSGNHTVYLTPPVPGNSDVVIDYKELCPDP